jgi:hypothetical protein
VRTFAYTVLIYALGAIAIPWWMATEILAGRWKGPRI